MLVVKVRIGPQQLLSHADSLNTGKRLRKRHHKQPQTLCPVQHFRCYACTRRTLFDSAIRCSRPSEHNCLCNCVLKSIWGWNKSSQHDLDTRKRCVRWLSALRVPNVTTPSICLQMRWRSLYRQVSLASPKLRFCFHLVCARTSRISVHDLDTCGTWEGTSRGRALVVCVARCVCVSSVRPQLALCISMCLHVSTCVSMCLRVSACLRAAPCISTRLFASLCVSLRLFALPHLLPSHCVSMRLVVLPYVVMRLLLSRRVSPGIHQIQATCNCTNSTRLALSPLVSQLCDRSLWHPLPLIPNIYIYIFKYLFIYLYIHLNINL